jgi:polyketide cyclase/dehydrase/lipid transport protein
MTTRFLQATLRASAADVIDRLADDLAFPEYANDLVSVTDAGDGLRTWVLAFRGGAATWTQGTRRAADNPLRVEFAQLSGQFQQLVGSWTATDTADGCEVSYEVRFSTSVPHLAGAIDSAVGRVLVRAAHQVLSAVGGPARVTKGEQFLSDLAEKTPSPV